MTAAVEAAPDADTYLLVDADVGASAARAAALLEPVRAGTAGMAVGVLPAAGRRGGFGAVRRLAAAGIRRAADFDARAPLSGQRAVDGDLLRSLLPLAEGFGLETALTVDALRAGATVLELDVAMDHRHTGRSWAGFRHRAGQGVDILRALWPRLTTTRARIGIMVGATVAIIAGALVTGSRWEPWSVAASERPRRVVIFGFPKLGWADVEDPRLPALGRLATSGAIAATSVRTASAEPSTAEGYASLGAGTRVKAGDQAAAAADAGDPLEGGTAAQALSRRTGRPAGANVVVVGSAATERANHGRHLSSAPGALGDALATAGRRVAVVGNADTGVRLPGRPAESRPAAAAVMTGVGVVADGTVSPSLLRHDPELAFGRSADDTAFMAAARRALADDHVVVLDPGDMDRAAEFAAVATPAAAARARRLALAHTDSLLGQIADAAGPGTLLLVVSVDPPGQTWHTTPMVASGAGVRPGYLHSPSVRRLGVVTITDVAPTVLDALSVPVPAGMIGHPLRYHPGSVDLGLLRRVDRDATFREGIYFPITLAYIIFQSALYLLAMAAFSRLGGVGRLGPVLRFVVLVIAAWPLATFVFRAIPGMARLGGPAIAVLLAVDAGIAALALRSGRRPLTPLSLILGATVLLIGADVATGARLQSSSILGYSLHTAARFTGIGNTAFAVLAASAILLAATHVHQAPRRREALVAVACLFALVVVVDGAPSLGDDIGGILTLVPVLSITLLVLSGRRLRARTLVAAGLAAVLLVGAAAAVDLARPVPERTHVGQLVGQLHSGGPATLSTTVARKLSTNLRTYKSVWCWVIIVVALYQLFLLGWAGGWTKLLSPRSALRTGVVATLVAGLVGNALNDSGAVVTALVFVYLGPFLTLLALADERAAGHEPPVLLEVAGTPRLATRG